MPARQTLVMLYVCTVSNPAPLNQELNTTMVFTTIRCCTLAVAMSAAVIGRAQAADPERGQQLYDNHCTVCHESQVHIREQRKARTLTDVRWQIARWQEVLKLPWTATEVDDVQAYLNAEYYHYETEQ